MIHERANIYLEYHHIKKPSFISINEYKIVIHELYFSYITTKWRYKNTHEGTIFC